MKRKICPAESQAAENDFACVYEGNQGYTSAALEAQREGWGCVTSEAQAFPLEYLDLVIQYLRVASDLWEGPLDGTDEGLRYQWSPHFFGRVLLWVKDY